MICEFDCETCRQHVRVRRSPANTLTPPRFCSQRCHGLAIRGTGHGPTPNYMVACENCGAVVSVYRSPSAVPPKFCSVQCTGEAQRGAHNPSFNGGTHILNVGYRVVLDPDNPAADVRGYVLEHRLIMERMIGRRLVDGEVVHHINGNRLDNREENLLLFASQSEHAKHHAEARR